MIRLSDEKLTIDCSTLQTKNFNVDDSQSIYAMILAWKRLVQIEEKNEDANRFETQQSIKRQGLYDSYNQLIQKYELLFMILSFSCLSFC